MPLYTYVISYNDSNYVAQGSHSNFRGFVNAWCTDLPIEALKGLNANLKKQLEKEAYKGSFDAVPNRKNVWVKLINLNGRPFTVYAVETKN